MFKKTTGGSLNVIKGFVVYVCVWARLTMFPIRVVRMLSKHPHGVHKVKYVVGAEPTDDLLDLLFKKEDRKSCTRKDGSSCIVDNNRSVSPVNESDKK